MTGGTVVVTEVVTVPDAAADADADADSCAWAPPRRPVVDEPLMRMSRALHHQFNRVAEC